MVFASAAVPLQGLVAPENLPGNPVRAASTPARETFKFLPLEKILIETDSPFLAPVPNRGKKNEPSYIDFTAKKLSEIKNILKSELISITTKNFNKLFFN